MKGTVHVTAKVVVASRIKMQIAEIGQVVYRRRAALGLSQMRLAKLAGLSRATINQLENGTLKDLGIAKLDTLLGLIGLQLNPEPIEKQNNGLRMAAINSSVSFRKSFEPKALSKALRSGDLPEGYEAHVSHLLDEAPLSLIIRIVEETASGNEIPPKQIWRHLEQWAHKLQSIRKVWT